MKRINVILCAAIVALSGVYAYVLTVDAQTPTPPYVFHCCRNGVCTTYYGTTGCEDGDTPVDGPCTPNPCVITGGEQDDVDIVVIVADLFPPMEAGVSGDRCHNEDPSLISILPPTGPGEPEPYTVWVTYESTTWDHAGVQVRLDTSCIVDWLNPDFQQHGHDPEGKFYIWTFRSRQWHEPSSHLVARLDCDVTELGVHPYVQFDREHGPRRAPNRIAVCTPFGCPEPDMPVTCEDEGGDGWCDTYSEECIG